MKDENVYHTRARRGVAAAAVTALAGAGLVAGAALAGPAAATTPLYEPLRDAAERQGIQVGFALTPSLLNTPEYRAIAEREFNLVVAENAMKWDQVQPSRGNFTWGGADQVVDFATANDLDVYGHTMVWHSQLAGWVENINDPTELRQVMHDHIDAIGSRYDDSIVAWDVVNEIWEENGTRRNSVFQRVLGDGFVAEAFHRARQAAPNAQLCINDYNTDGINAKSNAMYNLVSDLLADGVPVDCVAFQSHMIVGQVPHDYQQNLQRFADLGVDVRITEVDIRTNTPASAQALAQQAQDYTTVVETCLSISRCSGITFWGIDDANSWIPGHFSGEGAALLWDANFQRKPAYEAVALALGAQLDDGSTPTPTPTSTPTPDPTPTAGPGGCSVTWSNAAWDTGYTGSVIITNTGSTAWDGWTLSTTLPSGQSLDSGWSAEWSQSGSTLTASNAPWNGAVPAGGSVQIGYNATHSGGSSAPTTVTVNGSTCS